MLLYPYEEIESPSPLSRGQEGTGATFAWETALQASEEIPSYLVSIQDLCHLQNFCPGGCLGQIFLMNQQTDCSHSEAVV